MSSEPNPTSWTIRLKHGRNTLLLYTSPLTPLKTLKSTLLSTLRERYPTGLPDSSSVIRPGAITIEDYETVKRVPIPEEEAVDDVEFGKMVDEFDIEKGWAVVGDEEESNGEGLSGSLKALGLKDGAVLAFRFKGEKDFFVRLPCYEDAYPEEAEGGMAEDDEE